MKSTKIQCVRCGHVWPINRQVSDFERQAIEANPCSKCGSYTLCCREWQAWSRRRSPNQSADHGNRGIDLHRLAPAPQLTN